MSPKTSCDVIELIYSSDLGHYIKLDKKIEIKEEQEDDDIPIVNVDVKHTIHVNNANSMVRSIVGSQNENSAKNGGKT